MQTSVAALVVLSVVTYVSAAGEFSKPLTPPFAIDDALVEFIPQFEKQIRTAIVKKLTENNGFLDSPILLRAYEKQVVAGMNYRVEVGFSKYIFVAYLSRPISGNGSLEKVIGPLVDGSPDRLTKA